MDEGTALGGLSAGAARRSNEAGPARGRFGFATRGQSLAQDVGAGSQPVDAAVSIAALASLRPREAAVLELMAAGMSNDAIGVALHISTKTVERHATAIFDALGVSTLPGANRRVSAVLAWVHADRLAR